MHSTRQRRAGAQQSGAQFQADCAFAPAFALSCSEQLKLLRSNVKSRMSGECYLLYLKWLA
jgi:hypothetical protein